MRNNNQCQDGNFCTFVHDWAIIKFVRSEGLQMCKTSLSSPVLARTLEFFYNRILASCRNILQCQLIQPPHLTDREMEAREPPGFIFLICKMGETVLTSEGFSLF